VYEWKVVHADLARLERTLNQFEERGFEIHRIIPLRPGRLVGADVVIIVRKVVVKRVGLPSVGPQNVDDIYRGRL
jgi:hypothetical protein